MTRRDVTAADGTRVLWFDGTAEFAHEAAACSGARAQAIGLKGWAGETWDEAVAGAVCGRTDHVKAAEALLEQVQCEVPALRSEWLPSRAGAYPVVPEALMGLPEPMRRKVSVPSERAPLRVFVDVTSSMGVPHDALARRGVACLALAMALGNERAVELVVVTGLSGRVRAAVAVRVPSSPLDLATACVALTSAGFARGLGYALCRSVGAGGDWLFGEYPVGVTGRARYVARLRAALDADEHDLVVSPTMLGDEATSDPVGFVRRGIAEHGGGEVV